MNIKSLAPAQPDHFVLTYESFSLFLSHRGEWHHVGKTKDVVNLPITPAFFAVDDTGNIAPVMDDLQPLELGETNIDVTDSLGEPLTDGEVLQGQTLQGRVFVRGTDPAKIAEEYRSAWVTCSKCKPHDYHFSTVANRFRSGLTDEFRAVHDRDKCTLDEHDDSEKRNILNRYHSVIQKAYDNMVKESEI